ncbi:MAG TPA: excinuclease ABC subunit UvrC [Candidatus Limnocylindria bacterium]|nr:excinuclease ABC subunit UvrC [Candidatus Limnocylindria bacterium]
MAASPSPSAHVRAILRHLPSAPGVYLFRAADRRVLYVGKANSLRGRVRNHFGAGGQLEARHSKMVADTADIEYIVTDTIGEAYILEGNLIKEHRPRFNIRLKDDKSYPFVRITMAEDFPRIVRTRKLVRDGSRYFGPYASASSVDETLRLLSKIFPFRTCDLDIPAGTRVLERPCLLYHIKRCQGPCIGAVETDAYRSTITQVVDFLEGRQEGIADQLRGEMETHSDALRYEAAAVARDKLKAVEWTIEQQKLAAFSREEHDVIGLARDRNEACFQVFVIRNGKMIGREHFIAEGAGDQGDEEVLASFLQQYYAAAERPPRSILVPLVPADAETLGAVLGRLRGSGVRLHVPARGAKRRLVALAAENAAEALAKDRAEWLADRGARAEALVGLARALDLAEPPHRIECYDMSNIQGTSAVGSMVVFTDGAPDNRQYRRFRIRSGDTPDDFRMMAEVLRRRFGRAARLRRETGAVEPSSVGVDEDAVDGEEWALPDLVIVDGGKGQLSAATRVLKDLGLDQLSVAGLAKRFEELFVPGRSDPIILPSKAPELYLVQRIRDEAHRFAITYHRQVRGRSALGSLFDDVPGIGPARRAALLRRFGSVRALRDASVEEIAAAPLMSVQLAERVKSALAREGRLA